MDDKKWQSLPLVAEWHLMTKSRLAIKQSLDCACHCMPLRAQPECHFNSSAKISPLTGTDAAEREQRAKFVCTMPSRKEEDEGQGVRGWVTYEVITII